MEDEIKMAKEGVSLVGELIKAAGDNPEVKAAGSNLGTAALTLSKAINNVLLPLAAVNFAFDKARKYFSEKFPEDMSASASKIPPESLIAPKASIAGPVLQCLTFAHDEPDLKSMYLGLLASSMDARVAGDVHPAFVEIIKQLDSREAKYLENLLAFAGTTYPIVEIRCVTAGQQGWFPIFRHLTSPSRIQLSTEAGNRASSEGSPLTSSVSLIRCRKIGFDLGS